MAYCYLVQTNGKHTRKTDFFEGYLQIDRTVSNPVKMELRWTDSYGRCVDVMNFELPAKGWQCAFSFPLDKAVAQQNFLRARLELDGVEMLTDPLEFIVTPEPLSLEDYSVIMYYPYEDAIQDCLRDIGITAGQSQNVKGQMSRNKGSIWWTHNFRYYCDQMAVEYYAEYHSPRYGGDKEIKYFEAKELYKKDRTKKDAFYRKPCFYDKEAEKAILEKITNIVNSQKEFKPLFYSTDECGVAALVAAWDFCFDPRTLAAMRPWLLEKYGSLEAINREWETNFESIDDVEPFTSDEAFARIAQGNYNLSPWFDHRVFMNLTFANAVRKATDTVHKADPDAKNGIVGCQMPAAFGGYDYWNLSKAMDIVEPYNIGNNRKMWSAFAPKKPAFTTFFACNDTEVWRLWYQAIQGDRGIIIYDEKNCYMLKDGTPTQDKGKKIAPTFKELTGGLVKQLSKLDRVKSQIAIHYSHPSVTAWWPLEVIKAGDDWVERYGWKDRMDSDFMRLRESVLKVLEDQQLPNEFVAYAQLENGEFEKMDKKLLILPQSIAMSEREVQAVKRFVKAGGCVVADCSCALMDGSAKMLAAGQLDEVFGIDRSEIEIAPMAECDGKGIRAAVKAAELNGTAYEWAAPIAEIGQVRMTGGMERHIAVKPTAKALFADSQGTPAVIVNNYGLGKAIYLNSEITNYHRWRLKAGEGEDCRALFGAIAKAAGVQAKISLQKKGDGVLPVEVYHYEKDGVQFVGLLRNYQLRINELGPTEYQDLSMLQGECDVKVDFGGRYAVYDVRKGKYLGQTDSVDCSVPLWEPVIYALLEKPAGSMKLSGSAEVCRGEIATVHAQLDGVDCESMHIFRCRVNAPKGSGADMRMHDQNLDALGGKVSFSFPVALSDPEGEYTVFVQDVVTGICAEFTVKVK